MYFTSDNWSGAHEKIAQALTAQAAGFSASYGKSDHDKQVEAIFNTLFEQDVAVYFVSTGTAANSMALASVNKTGGVSFCHRESHIIEDECGAPEFFTNGSRLRAIDGKNGKIDPELLELELKRFPQDSLNAGQMMAVSITQATEIGTLYTIDEIKVIAKLVKKYGLPLHMDGARFANAVAALGCTPAEMTWMSGVDILSFGGTKNGCWCAEALIYMNPDQAKDLPYLRKRSAQLFSKTRFISAQFEAYLQDGLWLDLATHANKMAVILADAVDNSAKMRMAWPRQANEVFAITKKKHADAAWQAGAHFYDWPAPHGFEPMLSSNEVLIRLVTSFSTETKHIEQFAALIN